MKGLSTQGTVANYIMSTVDYHRKLWNGMLISVQIEKSE